MKNFTVSCFEVSSAEFSHGRNFPLSRGANQPRKPTVRNQRGGQTNCKSEKAAAIIRADDVRTEQEKRARLEAEEAKVREEQENYKHFRAAIQELAKRFGRDAFIITNAFDKRTYDGLLLSTVERNGHHYAAQLIDEGRVILHGIGTDDLSKIRSWSGEKVEIQSIKGHIGTIAEEQARCERNRGWSR